MRSRAPKRANFAMDVGGLPASDAEGHEVVVDDPLTPLAHHDLVPRTYRSTNSWGAAGRGRTEEQWC